MNTEMRCSLCHETVPDLHETRAGRVCFGCADALDYYDRMSPQGLRAEEDAIARYTAEAGR